MTEFELTPRGESMERLETIASAMKMPFEAACSYLQNELDLVMGNRVHRLKRVISCLRENGVEGDLGLIAAVLVHAEDTHLNVLEAVASRRDGYVV